MRVCWGYVSLIGTSIRVRLQDVEATGVPVTLFEKFLAFGASNPAEASPGEQESLCTVMYTSGTTGQPKGVEITHRAVLASVGALTRLLSEFNVKITYASSLERS
jgi:long-chain acyl-CoA synthetase